MSEGVAMVSRYLWLLDDNAEGDRDFDQVCIDQITGREVVRYDLGDPANYDSRYGGRSRGEYLERKGLNPLERIRSDQIVNPKNLYRDIRLAFRGSRRMSDLRE